MIASGVVADLAPTGTLRASINVGNPVLAQGPPTNPSGITVDIAREVATRLGVPCSCSASTPRASRTRR
jgi:polar amino acid transport system substrate-binding protein